MLLLLPVMFACSDDVADVAQDEPIARTEVPVLAVRDPARATFLGDVDRVTVSGEVATGSGRLTTLTVNGRYLDVGADGGSFSDELPVSPGIAILGSRVETDDGERAVDGRAVLAGPVHAPGERLSDTVKIQLGPEVLDDDDDDLDDVATLAETMMSDPSVAAAFVGMELPTDSYTLTITDATFGRADVDVVPGANALTLSLTIHDVWVDFDVAGSGWYSWVSTTGSTWADSADIVLDVEITSSGGESVATPLSTVVTLNGYGVTVEWFPDGLEGYLADWTQEDLEAQLAADVEARVGGMLAEYLGAFSADTEYAGMRMRMELASARVGDWGVGLTLDAWVDGDAGFDLPDGAGSLATEGTGPVFPLTSTAPFAMAADDDYLNQLLFQVWASGSLHGLAFGALEMTALAGEIPAPLGPVAEVALQVDLPPVMGEATFSDQEFDLSIGEMRLRVTREDGVVTDASINVRTGGTLGFTDDGELSFALDDRPAYMTLEVGIEEAPPALDPGDMAALVKLSVPPMFGALSNFLPAFPAPSVPLDAFGDAFAGEVLVLADPTARVDGGWLVVEGALAAP